MQLKLLPIEDFIRQNNVLEITSLKLPSKTKLYTEPTLWSENIFGRIGSNKRKTRFGYINMNTEIINPPLHRILKGLNSAISAIMDSRKSYRIEDGKLIEDKDNGSTGISFLIKHLKELDLEAIAKKDKKKEAKYLTTNKHLLTITKLLVIPAGSRDLDINGVNTSVSEINTIYLDIMTHAQDVEIVGHDGPDEVVSGVVKQLQWHVQRVYSWLSNRLTGKKGIFRSNLLKKSTDYSSRLVLASSPEIKFGHIGLPWYTLASLYEPLFFFHIKNQHPEFEADILEFMKIKNADRVSNGIMQRFVKLVDDSPKAVPPIMKSRIKQFLSEFLDDETVLYKRDPALSRKSWASATPIVTDGGIATVNSLDLGPLGGDCITGNISVFENVNENWLEKIIDIGKFNEIYDTTLVSTNTRKDGIVVHEYTVNSKVYARGINPQTGELTSSEIKKWWIHENLNMYEVSISKSRANVSRIDNLECSSHTSLLAYDPETCEFVSASPLDINKESKLMMIKDTRLSAIQSNILFDLLRKYGIYDYDNTMDLEFGWFIGAWLGDGSVLGYDRSSTPVAFSNCDPELHTRWATIARMLTNNSVNEYANVSKSEHPGFFNDASRKAKRTSFNDQPLRNFILDNFGKRSGGKFISDWVLSYTNEFAIGLFAGLIDTDGSATTNYVSMTSKSKRLLVSLKNVLDYKFNITSTIHSSKSNMTNKYYPVISIRMSKIDRLFWDTLSDSICNFKTAMRIMDTVEGKLTVNKTMKYLDPNCLIDCKPDAKKTIDSRFMSTTRSAIINSTMLKSNIARNLINSNQIGDLEIIPFSCLDCIPTDTTTAYDLTVDEYQRSFITESRLIVKNSDGDAIQIMPVFTAEAKKAAEKLNPAKSASKWRDTNSNADIVYSLSLDTVSAIFHATRE